MNIPCCIILSLLALSGTALAQDASRSHVIANDFWESPRARAMSNAISPIAEGIDAPFYNPAGIGGIEPKRKRQTIRQLHFPAVSAGESNAPVSWSRDFGDKNESKASTRGQTIIDAGADKPNYGRLSVMPNVVLGRMMLAYSLDNQISATKLNETDELVSFRQRQTSAAGLGLSVTDGNGNLYLGVYTAYLERTELLGNFLPADVADPTTSERLLEEDQKSYEGTATHVGALMRLGKHGKPTLSAVLRDVGTTQLDRVGSSQEKQVTKENLTIGFGLSPHLGDWGNLNWVVEAADLTNEEDTLNRKLQTGIEVVFGEKNHSDGALILRSGYSYRGPSFGAGFNLGLVGLHYGSYQEDVGTDSNELYERREGAMLTINVAQF